jgi:hypothetical protein
MNRRVILAIALLAVVALGVGLNTMGNDSGSAEPAGFDPVTWLPDVWQVALGGDPSGPDAAGGPVLTWDARLTPDDVAALDQMAREVALAELTGAHPSELGTYFARNHPVIGPLGPPPSGAATRHCTEAEIRTVAGAPLPVAGVVKLAVVWQARCPFLVPSAGPGERPEAISFLYALPASTMDPLASRWGGWVPVHPLAVPGAASAARGMARVPSEWELETLEGCVDDGVLVRGELVYAWAALCAEATAAGVSLVATEGWRSPGDQQRLWERAVSRWGAEEARRRIAFSDGERCLSRHCAGEAIDIKSDPATLAWLRAPVGCLIDGVFHATSGTCTGQVVERVARYGFAFTIASSPGHLDYLAGTTDIDADWYGDCTPGPVAVVDLVRLVFTCRAIEAGLSLDTAATVAANAVAVAQCTSAFNPASIAHGGRFVNNVNPATGTIDDRAGVFGLSEAVAANHVVGGSAARGEAWANVDGAARLWVHERSWGRWGFDPFGCAAGDDGAQLRVLD